jgi:dienelactone hydrolase
MNATTEPDAGEAQYPVQMLKTATGVEFGMLGSKPATPTPTVFWLGGPIQFSGVEIVPFLVERGYLCVALDTPGHGRDREPGDPEKGMLAWRRRIEAKRDFLSEFNQRMSNVIDYLIAEGWTDPDRVAILGGSRGAFIGFHYAAGDPRVKCIAGLIPLLELGHLQEFEGMENDPATRALDAINIAERLAGRKVLVIIGDQDYRAGVDYAVAFARQVSKVAEDAVVELHVLPEPRGHFDPEGTQELTEAWLIKHLGCHQGAKNG